MNTFTGRGYAISRGKCVENISKSGMQCQVPVVSIFICFSPIRKEQQLLESKLLVEGETILRDSHLSIK